MALRPFLCLYNIKNPTRTTRGKNTGVALRALENPERKVYAIWTKMKVLLANPSWDGLVSRTGKRYNKAWPPLDLLHIAAFLEHEKIDFEFIDGRADPALFDRFKKAAHECDKVFLTSAPLDRWECPNLDIDSFKVWSSQVDPEKLIIMGSHGTMAPEMIQSLIPCRAIVRGETEWTALELCQTEDLSKVQSITYRNGERWIANPDRPAQDINSLPMPAYHLLDMEKYQYEVLGERFLIYETTRGCPYRCNYCSLIMYGRKHRKKSIEKVIEEIRRAIEVTSAETLYFIDLEFTVDRNYTLKLCDALIREKFPLRWCCQTRLDTIDEEMLRQMKRAGCQLIHFGVESGSQRIIDLIDKNLTLDQIRSGFAMTKKAGIEQLGFFMLGFPTETEAEMQQTIDLAKELNPTYASFHVATPYPKTELYERIHPEQVASRWEKSNGALPENYGKAEDLTRLRRWEAKAYREFYLRPRYIASRLMHGNMQSWYRQAKLFWGYAH